MAQEFYVYTHTKVDTGEVFYVGKGKGRRRISENLRGRVASEETRAKLSLAHLGKPKTPEQIKKHADAIRGRKLAPHHAEILRLSATGRKVSEETRRKISASNRGQVRSDETKRKLSESHLGNIPTLDTRAKMAQAHAKRTQTEKDATYGARRKVVLCSNGMTFESLVSATLWVKSVNPKASKGCIGKAAIGSRRSAYGFNWSYVP